MSAGPIVSGGQAISGKRRVIPESEKVMNNKQRVAILAPLVLIAMMQLIFQSLSRTFGERIGWYLGLVLYWLIWGGAFSWWVIGRENIRRITRPQKLTPKIFLLVLFPLLLAALYKFVPGMGYEKPNPWIFLLLLTTPVANGFFEELLWRGVYMSLFPGNLVFRIVWPSIWFALWHFVPGSVSSNGNVIGLIFGSGLMGFYLAFLAKKTDSIWWTIVMHTIGGYIMIL